MLARTQHFPQVKPQLPRPQTDSQAPDEDLHLPLVVRNFICTTVEEKKRKLRHDTLDDLSAPGILHPADFKYDLQPQKRVWFAVTSSADLRAKWPNTRLRMKEIHLPPF